MSNREKKPIKTEVNNYTVPRRAVWFVLRTLLVVMAITMIILFFFLKAMHSANIYILVTEGVTLRANCILGKAEEQEMEQYFSLGCINNDKAFEDNIYDYYNITSFDYRLTVDDINVWPWNKTASMTVTERIPTIVGTAYENAPSSAVPDWKSCQYKVICLRENNRWYINKITVLNDDVIDPPRATPNMSLTPITPKPTETAVPQKTAKPKATPTPAPTQKP